MPEIKSTRIDPRERLVTVGNQLLDAIYELDETQAVVTEMNAVKDDKEKLAALVTESGVEVLIRHLTVQARRDTALREYVTIRQTIEALTGGVR